MSATDPAATNEGTLVLYEKIVALGAIPLVSDLLSVNAYNILFRQLLTLIPPVVLPYSEVQHEVKITSILNHNKYTIPVGNWYQSGTPISLEIDSGGGYVPKVLGVDYFELGRYTSPATVADMKIGFELAAGPVPAGNLMKFKWVSRTLPYPVPPLAKVNLAAGVPDYSIVWNPPTTQYPNGITIPEYPNVSVEFWRQTRLQGGKRGRNGVLYRAGRRFVPYFRGIQDKFTFTLQDFLSDSHTMKKTKFRVCYVDVATGARSELSSDIIQVCERRRDDRINNYGVVRYQDSVWII